MAKTKKMVVETGVVLPSYLNVREAPEGRILHQLKKGAVVNIGSEKDAWCKVQVNQITGWVRSEFLKRVEVAADVC